MTRELRFAKQYWCDLHEITTYYSKRGSHLVAGFEAAVKHTIERIKTFPESAPLYLGKLRRCRVPRLPYCIGYCVTPEKILVVGVIHTSRDDAAWAGRVPEPE